MILDFIVSPLVMISSPLVTISDWGRNKRGLKCLVYPVVMINRDRSRSSIVSHVWVKEKSVKQ